MELIIEQLSEIEHTAERIMQAAQEQKKEIAKEMELKTKEYDESVDKKTEKRLSELADEYKLQMEKELIELRERTRKASTKMEEVYQKHQDEMAKALFHRIVGV